MDFSGFVPAEQELRAKTLRMAGFAGRQHVIDYGCGRGPWTLALAQIANRATGIDVEPTYIEDAKRVSVGIPNVAFECAPDLRGVRAQSADGIICIGTFQVLQRGDLWHSFFEEAGRVLVPGGRILANFCNPAFVARQMATLEPFRYLATHGPYFCIDRMAGYARILARDLPKRSVTKTDTPYVVRRSAARRLFERYGFSEAGTFDGGAVPIYGARRDHWFVIERGLTPSARGPARTNS